MEDRERKPCLIEFPEMEQPGVGIITIAETAGVLPFDCKRVFWTYNTPESILRGRHAHYITDQIIVAITGRILVTTELPSGEVQVFVLENPHHGLHVPPNVWHTLQYSANAVQLVLASTFFEEGDYIRDYAKFKQIWK